MAERLIWIACLTGFVGDSLLQIAAGRLNLGGNTGWGLKKYFVYHGSGESLCIASGMMTLFYIAYYFSGAPFEYLYLGLYGVALDLVFRKTMAFESLREYYRQLNYFWSAVWGAIPIMLPLFIYRITAR